MKKKLVILFIVLLIVINISALLTISYHRWFSGKCPPIMKKAGMSMNFIQKELDLSDEQADKFKVMHKNFQQEAKAILDSLDNKRKDFFSELSCEEPDSESLNKLIEEMSDMQKSLKEKTLANLLKVRSFLTPQQQRDFISFFNKRMKPMGMTPNQEHNKQIN